MLSNSTSSIQRRRQQHRRQQSLEAPILATQLPAKPRRNRQPPHGHRRGLSLDQGLSTLEPPTGFRRLPPTQEQHSAPSGSSPSVRIHLDHTNTGQPTHLQHFVQETQQSRPILAQPGYSSQDFQSHLQQQLNDSAPSPVDFKPSIASPQPQDPQQQRALQELQHHMEWYRNQYGGSPNPQLAPAHGDGTQIIPMPGGLPASAISTPMVMMHPAPQSVPQTPIMHARAHTMPNSPQPYANNAWPSPPPSHVKHGRSQSFQLDVAPMPDHSNNGIHATRFGRQPSFVQDPNAFGNDAGYASSAYSASIVDGMSPGHQHSGPMPTLFEEDTPPMGPSHQGPLPDSLLLQAAAGAHEFNDPDFDFDGPILPSPQQQLLNNLGPDVPASIVPTGVDAYEVQRFIGELDASDNKYPCLFESCGRRFGRKENVRAHVQTHLGDRQFKCNLCDKTFVRQHDLKRHIAIHSEDRPFVCPCGTGFARHDALTRHRQRGTCEGVLPGYERNEEDRPKRGRPKKERPNLEDRVDKASKQRKKNKFKQTAISSPTAGGAQDDSDFQILYANSSSSAASDRSFPTTPPGDSFDADAFLNMAGGEMDFNTMPSTWRDTPPTSPISGSSPSKPSSAFDFNAIPPATTNTVGISPAMLSTHSSPPAANAAHTPTSQHDIDDIFASCVSPPNGTADSFMGGSSPAQEEFYNAYCDSTSDGATQPHANATIFDAFSPPDESNSSNSLYNYSEHESGVAAPSTFEKGLYDFAKGNLASLVAVPGSNGGMEEALSGMLDDWLSAHP